MSGHESRDSRTGMWRGVYRASLGVLPRALREKHGVAMVELFSRELDRHAAAGIAAVTWTAASALGDLLRRGLYERVREERAALTEPAVRVLGKLGQNFAVSFVLLTGLLVANFARTVADWPNHSATSGTLVQAMVLAIPFTAALTMPMAVFIAVLATYRRGQDRSDPAAGRRTRWQNTRVTTPLRMAPIVGLASLLVLFAFTWNAEVVPRSNARLLAMKERIEAPAPSDRTMTLSELRAASHRAQQTNGTNSTTAQREAVASYGVEMHKKSAIAAACLVFALLAMGIGRWLTYVGVGAQLFASISVFTTYYVVLTGGESLADQLIISPALAMWSGNVVLLAMALLMLRHSAVVSYARS